MITFLELMLGILSLLLLSFVYVMSHMCPIILTQTLGETGTLLLFVVDTIGHRKLSSSSQVILLGAAKASDS